MNERKTVVIYNNITGFEKDFSVMKKYLVSVGHTPKTDTGYVTRVETANVLQLLFQLMISKFFKSQKNENSKELHGDPEEAYRHSIFRIIWLLDLMCDRIKYFTPWQTQFENLDIVESEKNRNLIDYVFERLAAEFYEIEVLMYGARDLEGQLENLIAKYNNFAQDFENDSLKRLEKVPLF